MFGFHVLKTFAACDAAAGYGMNMHICFVKENNVITRLSPNKKTKEMALCQKHREVAHCGTCLVSVNYGRLLVMVRAVRTHCLYFSIDVISQFTIQRLFTMMVKFHLSIVA